MNAFLDMLWVELRKTLRSRMRQRVAPGEVDDYFGAMSLSDCWAGLARYWDKHVGSAAGA
ncbi:MAG: hypothetical protein NTY02_02710 [Acidobacteria bacterium]|nr:hypothetical protein [Acidobacteriota bacterium]